MVCTVETDIGITGIGEGGSKDTLEQCAGTLIGKDPFKIEAIWQEMYIAWFYPPGREKMHALGALDLALWDIKGKALGLPVHEMLGGSGAQLLRVLRHDDGGAGRRRAGRRRSQDRAKARDGRRLPRVPHGRGRRRRRRRLQHARRGAHASSQQCKEARAGRRSERRLVHRLPPAFRLQRRRCAPAAGSRSSSRTSSRIRCSTSTRCRTSRSCGR